MKGNVDIRRNEKAVEAINDILSNGGIAEVKFEPRGLTVVQIERKVKHPPKEK